MFTKRWLAGPAAAVALTVGVASPALAAASVTVEDATLQPGGSSVNLAVTASCDAPSNATSYLTVTLWQGEYRKPRGYVEGQGQTQIVCDGAPHSYSLTATTTVFYADKRFRPGRAMTEWTFQYCVRIDETTTHCEVIFPLIRQAIRIHP